MDRPLVTSQPDAEGPPASRSFADRARTSLNSGAGWLIALTAMYLSLVASDYQLRDADSTLYEAISTDLATRPVADWIAPDWAQGRAKSGLFQEHPAPFFWPAAALEVVGFDRGMLLANLLFYLGALWALFQLTRALTSEVAGWSAVFLYVLSPIGIQYLVRGNHENAWAMFTVLALWCLVRSQDGVRWWVGFVVFGVLACAVKGVLAGLMFPAAAVYCLVHRRSRVRDLGLLFLGGVAVLGVALLYEWAYAARTGQSFFGAYVGAQLTYVENAAAVSAPSSGGGFVGKLLNPPYYVVNLAWFSLPASLLLLASWIRSRRLEPMQPSAKGPLRLLLSFGGAWLVLLSIMTRRAVRYAFPVLPLLAAAGAVALGRIWPRAFEVIERRRRILPWLLMAVLVLLTVGRAVLDSSLYREVNLLPGYRVNELPPPNP